MSDKQDNQIGASDSPILAQNDSDIISEAKLEPSKVDLQSISHLSQSTISISAMAINVNSTDIITTTTTTATTSSAKLAKPTTSTSTGTHFQRHLDILEPDAEHAIALKNALDRLDPDKNGLHTVQKEITSSTLTTRLRGVCKINRLIDNANNLCGCFDARYAKIYHGNVAKFRNWIIKNKIIEQIFGPNCHVEIIKQSHTILNFVARSLSNEHINAIWSASSLKHCGRQVLDLLTSLVRSMRSNQVLHLYWLVKNLNVEEHTEHTLLLTSHILRFIWSHSPCINTAQLFSLQRNQSQFNPIVSQHHDSLAPDSPQDETLYNSSHNAQKRQSPDITLNQVIASQDRYPQVHPELKQSILQRNRNQSEQPNPHSSDRIMNEEANINNSKENIDRVVNTLPTIISTSTTSLGNISNSNKETNGYIRLGSHTEMQWYATNDETQIKQHTGEQSGTPYPRTSQTISENDDHKANLRQFLIASIKDVNDCHINANERHNSPIDNDNENDIMMDRSHCLIDKSEGSKSVEKQMDDGDSRSLDQHESSHCSNDSLVFSVNNYPEDLKKFDPELDSRDILDWERNCNLPDYGSDVDACCSEDKDMADFEDEGQSLFQDETTNDENCDFINPDLSSNEVIEVQERQAVLGVLRSNSKQSESLSSTRDSDGKSEHENDHIQRLSQESVAQFVELKDASVNVAYINSHTLGDEDLKKLSEYNLANLAREGKTLLWDLLQDNSIDHLAPNLHIEVENVLVNLVMSFGDKYIRYKFIEACLENLSNGSSVIVSLRLLPRLMSFNTMTRNLSIPAVNETYTIVLWAEREHNMSKNFFKNLVDDYRARKNNNKLTRPSEKTLYNSNGEKTEEIGTREPMFSHLDAIITRMSFLTFIYSKPFSPVSMGLNREQMDQLWDCLASDDNLRCSDVLFQWIYQQAIGEDFHGVDDELLLYILKNKLPSIPPEQFRLRGLKLLEQLLWIRQDYECCHELEHPATRHLWDIALKAKDDEVSMAAIRILNHFYIYTNHQRPIVCEQGGNFMRHCMDHLESSISQLKRAVEPSDVTHRLDMLQRVVLLIRTHLEVFKAHWSYYLRVLQLNSEADLVSHRLSAYDVKLTMTIRLVCQAASNSAKTTLEVQATDLMGELRAEIVKWWFTQVDTESFAQSNRFSQYSSIESPTTSSVLNQNGDDEEKKGAFAKRLDGFTEFLLDNYRSLRIITHNSQEIPFDWDERQINELDFKDMQILYMLNEFKPANLADSADDLESEKSENDLSPQTPPFPAIETIPSFVLQAQENFELLMDVDKYLGSFQGHNADSANRSKTLSRRVWEIIQILPTNPHYKEALKRCGSDTEKYLTWTLKDHACSQLISAECPQRLLYSLQIVDILRTSHDTPYWSSIFIRKGGLADLYDVFMSQSLLPNNKDGWNDWLQECLAYLLKLLFQFGTKSAVSPGSHDSHTTSNTTASGRHNQHHHHHNHQTATNPYCNIRTAMAGNTKRARRNKNRVAGTHGEKFSIPIFSDELLSLLSNTNLVFDKLIRILESSALCRCPTEQYHYVTMSTRAMILHHVMSFLSSWCKSDHRFPEFQISNYKKLLKALILDDTDPSSRREACSGFFKLHYACASRFIESVMNSSTSTTGSDSSMSDVVSLHSNNSEQPQHQHQQHNGNNQQALYNSTFSADLLACLVEFLPIAESMKPPRSIRNCLSESEYIKELNSPGCKDYFWLTCRLIDAPNTCLTKQQHKHYNDHDNHNHEQPQKKQPNQNTVNHDEQNDQEQHQQTSDIINSSNLGEPLAESPPTYTSSGITLDCKSPIDLHELCKYLVSAIRRRPVYETRDYSVEDDTLRGMLLMMAMSIKRDPSFRYTKEADEFIVELYGYLFATPREKCRYLPKCKSAPTRSTAFDLMLGLVECCPKNYSTLLTLLLRDQSQTVSKVAQPTEYWPHDDCRSEVGFVGLVNLGATCYLATCMQHLFMIPDLRYAILSIKDTKNLRHGDILRELQKIFAFMLESERKAYNPRNFCKVYTMDNHPLNIAEQTDMTEFLTDLITKLEESSPSLKQIIKCLFSGTLSNNVVSLDCPHISRTSEEFYTLRVQVADMRNLNDSLDELTVKDTLEGDNMYTCSTCEKKVRAEKRACIVKLPRILCFNTMRYTFNMATMTKEKVNTHFSFPLKLDMSNYLESNLMKRRQQSPTTATSSSSSSASNCNDSRSSSRDSISGSSDSIASTPSLLSPLSSKGTKNGSIAVDSGRVTEASTNELCQASSGAVDSGSDSNINRMMLDDDDVVAAAAVDISVRTRSDQLDAAGAAIIDHDDNASNSKDNNRDNNLDTKQENSTNTSKDSNGDSFDSETMYELIGVTVHTGNADGGHYYCFIRDCEDQTSEKPRWYLFNDAEVKPFDDTHLGTECFGGELTTKSYDAINDRFMDFSIEKTNSAYMLFYKRMDYKYRSRSVASRYLESDTQRHQKAIDAFASELAATAAEAAADMMSTKGGDLAATSKSLLATMTRLPERPPPAPLSPMEAALVEPMEAAEEEEEHEEEEEEEDDDDDDEVDEEEEEEVDDDEDAAEANIAVAGELSAGNSTNTITTVPTKEDCIRAKQQLDEGLKSTEFESPSSMGDALGDHEHQHKQQQQQPTSEQLKPMAFVASSDATKRLIDKQDNNNDDTKSKTMVAVTADERVSQPRDRKYQQQQQQHQMLHARSSSPSSTAKRTTITASMTTTGTHHDAPSLFTSESVDFERLSSMTYGDFSLPRHLANWVWNDNSRFSRDQFIFEHNYFDFIWQLSANVSRTLWEGNLVDVYPKEYFEVSSEYLSVETVHLSIIFLLGVLMNSRERPNLNNWTELLRKQFNSSRAACDWLMRLIDDEDTWLKQMLQRCPIEMVRQLFQRLRSDLTGAAGGSGSSGGGSNKQHKKLRLVK